MKLLRPVFFSVLFALSLGITEARSLSGSERATIDQYLQNRGLNRYGDPQGTFYTGGSPLFDEASGQVMDRHEFVLRKHPQILEDHVGLMPVDRTVKAAAGLALFQNDLDARRSSEKYLEALVNVEAENALLALSAREAIDAMNYQAVEDILNVLRGMDRSRLAYFSTVLRDVRRMLQLPTIDEIRMTEKVKKLIGEVDTLEIRIQG